MSKILTLQRNHPDQNWYLPGYPPVVPGGVVPVDPDPTDPSAPRPPA